MSKHLETGSSADFLTHARQRAAQADGSWQTLLRECVFCVGSEASGHVICVLIALANAAAGGATAATGHDMTTSLMVGTGIYGATVAGRYAWSRGTIYPSFKAAALSLTIGLAVSVGIGKGLERYHQQDMAGWYGALTEPERLEVRRRVHLWLEKQPPAMRASFTETASLMRYRYVEEYIITSYCSPSNKELMDIMDDAKRGVVSKGHALPPQINP